MKLKKMLESAELERRNGILWSIIKNENDTGNKGISYNVVWCSTSTRGSWDVDRLFCAKCRKSSVIKPSDDACPICGQKFRTETNGINTIRYYNAIRIKGIPVVKIFGNNVCLWYDERVYFLKANKKVYGYNALNTMCVSYGVTFNTATGQSYAYKRNRKQNCLRNISSGTRFNFGSRYDVSSVELNNIVGLEIRKELFDKIKEMYRKKGIEVSTNEKNLEIEDLALINRFPQCDPSYIRKFSLEYYGKLGKEIKAAKNMNSHILNGPEILNLFKIKEEHRKKVFKSFIFQYPETLKHYSRLKYLKSVDNLIRLMSLFQKWRLMPIDYKFSNYKIRSFLCDIFKSNKESVITNKILNSNLSEFLDTCYMYCRLKELKSKEKINWNGSLKEIHDNLDYSIQKIKNENRAIEYTKKTLKLNNKNLMNYSFTLAKDTDELKDVGKKLRICVGSYNERALRYDCYIVFVKSKDEYIACLEIDSKKECIIQAKIACNKRPESILKEAIEKWCERNKLSTDKCYDLKSSAKPNYGYVIGNALPF